MLVLLFLLSFFELGVFSAPNAKWEFYAFGGLTGMLSYGRVDPIISPGIVSQHVHQIQGANAMQASYNYDTIRNQSTCTTLQVQGDLSNYWSPAMYHYDGASNFSLMLSKFNVYYWQDTNSYDSNNDAGSDTRVPFPEGHTMIAGNPAARSVNLSDPASSAAIFQCVRSNGNSPYSHDFRDFQRDGVNCDLSLRSTVDFPSCWDGVDNTDLTHVVYPTNKVCPASHPHAFMHLVYEWYYPVQNFPFDPTRTNNWVLANGDTSGYGMHGDFSNGWDIDLLTDAIAQCNTNSIGIENCPPFAKWNNTQIPPCMPSGNYPNENVGLNGQSLTALPGCNPLWSGNSTKPTCDSTPTPPLNLQLGPDLTSWNYLACPVGFTDQGTILTNFSINGYQNMTVDYCLDTCASHGYKYAGLACGTDCLCDNQLQNGGQAVNSPLYQCLHRCPTKYTEFCGNEGTIQLYEACTGDACQANADFSSSMSTSVSSFASSTTATSVMTTTMQLTVTATSDADSTVTTKTERRHASTTALVRRHHGHAAAHTRLD